MNRLDLQRLIHTLLECALTSENCAASFLEKEFTEKTRLIELTRDCAEICFQSAQLLQRKSEIALKYLTITEEICRLCAEECGKHEEIICQKSAEICNECAEYCNESHLTLTKEEF